MDYYDYKINGLKMMKKHIIKKGVKQIRNIDDSKGKLKNLIFEGEYTRVYQIISPSLREIHNYSGVIDDTLIDRCPNLKTIYFNADTELNLSYNNDNKIEELYLFDHIDNKNYLFKLPDKYKIVKDPLYEIL